MKKTFDEAEAKAIMIKIWSGLKIFQNCSVFHQDIKPDNILFGKVDNDIKIADFGHSICINMMQWVQIPSPSGTPGYNPQEN